MGRGLFFESYTMSRGLLWISGVLIFIVMMATAFLGYILPWGQMSFWGATVITNLFSAIPRIGPDIALWMWGGYSVDNATLVRFFSLHYLLPFLLVGLSLVHLYLLHLRGSSNPCGGDDVDYIAFYPYFFYKDLVGILFVLIIYLFFVFYYPNYLGHTDNYIPANPLSTPSHIVPEWYFLPFYAILRAIPHKLGGVLFMACALLILLFLPLSYYPTVRTTRFRYFYKIGCTLFLVNFFLLGWLGGQPVTDVFLFLSRACTFYYFFFLGALLVFFNLRSFFFSNFLNFFNINSRFCGSLEEKLDVKLVNYSGLKLFFDFFFIIFFFTFFVYFFFYFYMYFLITLLYWV